MAKNEIKYIWTDKKRTLFGLPLSFTRYYLTQTKFITRTGFLNQEEDELELYKVLDKKLKLPFFQRMFHCGTIILNVKDVDTPIKDIHSIKMPRAVSDLIDQCVNDQKDRYRIRGRDMMGSLNHEDCDCEHDDACEGEGDYDDGYAGE